MEVFVVPGASEEKGVAHQTVRMTSFPWDPEARRSPKPAAPNYSLFAESRRKTDFYFATFGSTEKVCSTVRLSPDDLVTLKRAQNWMT